MIISVFIGILSLAMVFYRDTVGAHLAGLSLTSAITIMQVRFKHPSPDKIVPSLIIY
jgi:hypothetical protein